MSKHHHPPHVESHTKDRGDHTHESSETQMTTAQHLLDDSQGRWLNKNQPDAVAKLVQDGVLPAGANFIDFDKVSKQIGKDRKDLDILNKIAPADIAGASKDLEIAKAKLSPAQQSLDGAQKAVDTLKTRIQGRISQDDRVQSDLDTLTADTKDKYFYGSTLKTLSEDGSKSQDVRDAAKRLLETFHKQGRGSSNSEYGTRGFGEAYIDQGSVSKKIVNDDLINKGDSADLVGKTMQRDNAKAIVDNINVDIKSKEAGLGQLGQSQKELEDNKKATSERINLEQQALKPDDKLAELGKVVNGGGYYQVAERLLGLTGKGHTVQQAHELKMLTHLLQDEEKKLHGGHLPEYLKRDDVLLQPENIAEVFESMRKLAAPEK